MSLRIVFAGTPVFSATCLQALLMAGLEVVAVYTQPDRPAGRGKQLQPSAVKALALAHQLPVLQPLNFRDPVDVAALAGWKPDLMVVVAYGLLLPQSVLDIPRLGCINVHASLLPRWRGAAPIERSIEAGDNKTGVTIMQMDKGLDTGDMLLECEVPITETTTGDSLREELAIVGSSALIETIHAIAESKIRPRPQDHSQATYAQKLRKEEAQIDWNLPAALLARKMRAFCSSNVCHTQLGEERIRIWEAHCMDHSHSSIPGTIIESSRKGITVACGEGALLITSLQLPNGKRMPVADHFNGRKELFAKGNRFV